MIEILRDQRQSMEPNKKEERDIIVTKYEEKVTYDTANPNIKKIELVPVKTNLTKKIQETAKLVKADAAREKMAEIEDAFKMQMENLKKELKK